MTTYINVHTDMALIAKTHFANNFAHTTLAWDEDDDTGIRITGDNDFDADDLPDDGGRYTNGDSEVKFYDLDDCRVFVESGPNDGLHIYPPKFSVEKFIEEWDWQGLGKEEWLASWGFDVTPDDVDEDATDVRIWVRRFFYETTLGAPIDGYLVDENHDAMIFDTVANAQVWIDEADSETYYLSHGEYARPEYTICN